MDGLSALEMILDRIVFALGDPQVASLVRPGRPSIVDVNEVLTAAAEGVTSLSQVQPSQCCTALRALCADVQPPLFSGKLISRINKVVRTNRSNPRISVYEMLLPIGAKGGSSTPAAQYGNRAAALVSKLLAVLASIGFADHEVNPLAIAKEWAPALGLETATLQLLLIRSKADDKVAPGNYDGASTMQSGPTPHVADSIPAREARKAAAAGSSAKMLDFTAGTPAARETMRAKTEAVVAEHAFDVTLMRSNAEGFGLGLGEAAEGGAPVVTEVTPGGVADRSGLVRVLDRVYAINGAPTALGMDMEAMALRTTLVLTLTPPSSLDDDDADRTDGKDGTDGTDGTAAVFEITLTRDPTEEFGLGVGFESGQVILSSIVAGSPAERCGELKVRTLTHLRNP